MHKKIEIAACGEFYRNRTDFVFVSGDVNAYEILLNLPEPVENAQLVVQAKRADGEIITDIVSASGKQIKCMLKNNIYSVPGEVTIRLQVVKETNVVTDCQCVFMVEEGYESDTEGDDRIPALTSLIIQAQTAANNANAAAARVPSAEEIEQITNNSHTHANKAILDAITDAPIPDAPSDSSVYGRKNGAWSEIVSALPTVTMAQVDVCDQNTCLSRGIYALKYDHVWDTQEIYGEQMYYEYDLLIVSDYYDAAEPYTTQMRITNEGKILSRAINWVNVWNGQSQWDDWSTVTYTKYEINQLINPTVKSTLTSPISANTIYDLGKQTALNITLPSASVGKFIQFDFVSGSTATTLTVNSSSGLTDFDLIPAANTVYSLYFDWGAIGYSGTSVTYGWRFSYSEYPIASV